MIDYVLAACLLLALPARAVLRSLSVNKAPTNPTRIYLQTGLLVSVLLTLLAWNWLNSNRAISELGLDIPLSSGGIIGLYIAGALVTTVFICTVVAHLRGTRLPNNHQHSQPADNNALPKTRAELAVCLIFAVFISVGWELLYRGFLMWFLVPTTGIVAGVFIAALAYGASHSFKTRQQLLGSMISAFLFTIAYAFTGSLWWLMLIHIATVITGSMVSYHMANGGLKVSADEHAEIVKAAD